MNLILVAEMTRRKHSELLWQKIFEFFAKLGKNTLYIVSKMTI